MKKMFVAAGLALALTASSGQKASAWCKFNCSAGINISYESTGSCWGWGLSCQPNPAPYGCASNYCCPTTPVYPPYAGYPAHAYGYGQQAAPAAAPQSRTQQVGYFFYGQGYAPSYWYGN
jgi:hypothetical protein